MRFFALFAILLFFASCTPLEKPKTEATSAPQATEMAKDAVKLKYYFNEPALTWDKGDYYLNNATPCGLPEAAFRAWVKERIPKNWKVIAIQFVWGNKQAGPMCVTTIIVYYREK